MGNDSCHWFVFGRDFFFLVQFELRRHSNLATPRWIPGRGKGDNDTPGGLRKPSTSQANNISRGQGGTAKTLENVGKPVSFHGIDFRNAVLNEFFPI